MDKEYPDLPKNPNAGRALISRHEKSHLSVLLQLHQVGKNHTSFPKVKVLRIPSPQTCSKSIHGGTKSFQRECRTVEFSSKILQFHIWRKCTQLQNFLYVKNTCIFRNTTFFHGSMNGLTIIVDSLPFRKRVNFALKTCYKMIRFTNFTAYNLKGLCKISLISASLYFISCC